MCQLVHQVIPPFMSSTVLPYRAAYDALLAADITSYHSTALLIFP